MRRIQDKCSECSSSLRGFTRSNPELSQRIFSWIASAASCLAMTVCLLLATTHVQAQNKLKLNLQKTIDMANDSSLQSFRAENLYLAGYWEYRTYKANRLPSLTLNLTPADYYRDITKRYDSENDIDVYRSQRSYSANGNLAVSQNVDFTGGTLFLDSRLGFIRNFGDYTASQYTSVPIRIGYSQNLIGYNGFRWEKKIEPLKYERVQKEFIYNMEEVSEWATGYFFDLAMAQAEFELARENVLSTDTLYRIGMQRHKIASISQADLLTLKLDFVNAQNTLQNKSASLKRAMSALATFLNLDRNTEIELDLPSRPGDLVISADKALMLAQDNNPAYLKMKQQILEGERDVDRTLKESRFNASVSASIGFNQTANKFGDVYSNPSRQEIASVNISIPLIDWGVRKGKYNMARNNLNVLKISSQQEEITLEEEVIMTVNEFNIQQNMIASAEEALDLSILAYEQTRQRFIIGKADINSLTLSLNRQQDAQRNYIQALHNYWLNYYKIRKLTLHDFETDLSLAVRLDYRLMYAQ